jgi:anti-sigma B factor antagonist
VVVVSNAFQPERLHVSRSRREPGVVVLTLYGELDVGTALKLEHAAARVLASEPVPEVLILDLSGLSFLSVAGARSVRAAHDGAGTARLRVVTGENPTVRDFLHATRFDAVLDCYRTRFAASVAGSRADFVSHAQACWDAS